jgi:hypothetical protein
MKRIRRYIWIDDKPSRRTTAEDLEVLSGVKVDFKDVTKRKLSETLNEVLAGPEPLLFIIDHILDQTLDQRKEPNRVLERGSVVAEALKSQWPSCPVIGVTAAKNEAKIDLRTKRSYDELESFTEFSKFMPVIPVIAKDFARVSRARIKGTQEILKLVHAPPIDQDRLAAILPDDLKAKLNDRSLPSRLYAWVQQVLVEKPGFLYDELASATLLGIGLQAFRRIRKRFDTAQYKGIFALPERQRWWVSTLIDVLYGKCPPRPREAPWEVGRRLSGISKKDHSRCFVCSEEFPETVAYEDATINSDRHPMHLRCTVPHPKFSKELFFDEIRVMKARR